MAPPAACSIRRLASGESAICERILRALPEWFGIEKALLSYVRDTQELETWLALAGGKPAGFLTLRLHNPQAAEIQVMAVTPTAHGRGIGRALVEHSERLLRDRGVRFLQVKTLGPSRPNEHYARTRGFYERLGFVPLEENHLWGDVNPCLIMVRHLTCDTETKE
jgi:ribosomal protein S18 acetylase RimI-like enzyme